MIVQPIGVPQSYLTLNGRFCTFFANFGSFLLVPGRAPDDGIVFLLRVVPETLGLPKILGNTRNPRFTRNIGYYPIFRVNPKFRVLPDISGIANKRKTIPSSGALLWEPQKGPQGAKKCKICHFNVKYDCGTPFGWTIIVQDL